MRTIIFKFNEDCRCFAKGQSKRIEINDNGFVWLVGENRCGKSTLLQLMRSRKNALSNATGFGNDRMSTSLNKLRDKKVDIEGLEQYDNIFYLDAIIDDPTSFENSASADLFVMNGGMAVSRQSKGQKALTMMSMFMKSISEKIGNNNGHNLIVLDEVDEGFDIAKQITFIKAVDLLRKSFNADIICVTHSIIPIMISDVQDVYDVTFQNYLTLSDYISLTAKKKIEISIGELTDKEEIDLLDKALTYNFTDKK